jgi:uncharacterized membrane protein
MGTNRLQFKRNLASTPRQRAMALTAIAVASFAFALFLGWFVGAWLILPFAGLEVGCVAAAFWWFERRSADCDVVEIGDSSILVTRQRGKARETHVFTRAWAQVDIEHDDRGRDLALRVRQSGRSVTFGEFLRSSERKHAAREIRAAMSQTWVAA